MNVKQYVVNRPFKSALTGLALIFSPAVFAFEVGERVFIPMFNDTNPNYDGYATGLVKSIDDEGMYTIKINNLVEGEGRTLYGTCAPNANTPLAGARIVSDDPEDLHVEQRLPKDKIMSWREGNRTFLARENVITTFQRWLGDGMGVTPGRLANAARDAQELGLPHLVLAARVAEKYVESTQGRGFPVPASRSLQNAAPMLDEIARQLSVVPDSLQEAEDILARVAPNDRSDLIAAVVVRIHELLEKNLKELAKANPDPREVSEFSVDELLAIYTGWAKVMTAQDQRPFQNADLAFYRERAKEQLNAGQWPELI